MKIGIDISQIIYNTGVSTYTDNLVRNLLSIDEEHDYLLFGGSFRQLGNLKEKGLKLISNDKVQLKVFPFPPFWADLFWNRLHFIGIEVLTGKLDVYHSSDWAQSPSKAFKVTTIHDLAPIRFPKLTHPKIVSTHKARLKWVLKEVDRVIVPSQATKEDLMLLKYPRGKIRVIPEAVDPFYFPVTKVKVDEVKKKYRIDSNYILGVGVGLRKNTDRLIEAYELIRHDKELKLVLVGENNGLIKEDRGVRLVGRVTQKELNILYSGALALVYPSLYEGFGLPILEAFACKCPVVTSNISSMPEVAGEAVEYVDPYNVSSIAEGINNALNCRKDLIKKGLKRVKEFSWQKTAQETLNVYKEALEK